MYVIIDGSKKRPFLRNGVCAVEVTTAEESSEGLKMF